MGCVREVAETINILAGCGYHDSATEYAAIHALNVSDIDRGMARMHVIEDAFIDLIAAKAVFDVSEAIRICIFAINTIDSAARFGVYLSVQDAVALATGDENA